MRIGYPCVNRSVGCSSSHAFRLASYSASVLRRTVRSNLDCLRRVIDFNASHGILFFRITSDLVPFASHPVCTCDWRSEFKDDLEAIGAEMRRHHFRASMHPDQFVLINAKDEGIFSASVKELEYHVEVLDLLGLDGTAKIQIHVGGVYGDRPGSIARFVKRYLGLGEGIRRRLVIENDDRNYSLEECLAIHRETGVPVLFDSFHHEIRGDGRGIRECLGLSSKTWTCGDGTPMVDYSSQEAGERRGRHACSLDPRLFGRFLKESSPHDIDIMLEIKDKEKSALAALEIAEGDPRLFEPP